MKLALLGGSFDPVHLGHLHIAEAALEALGADLVLLVPSNRAPHKGATPGAKAVDRLALLRAAVAGRPRLLVDDCEIRRGGVSYTIDTIADLERRYAPVESLFLILGDDLAGGFGSWRRADELASRTHLVLASRADPSTPFPYPHVDLGNPLFQISSSELRGRIAAGGPWHSFVPEGAARIIEERGLYGYEPKLPDAGLLSLVDEYCRRSMSATRYGHARSVATLAASMASRNGLDPTAAFLAGIAHDLAKELPAARIAELAQRDGEGVDELEAAKPSLMHGRAAATLLRECFGVGDGAILEAVACHTFGKPGMGRLAAIVYVADKVEWGRKDVDASLRERVLESDIETAFREILEWNLAYLRGVAKAVDPRTLALAASLGLDTGASR